MFCNSQCLVKHHRDAEEVTPLSCRSWYCALCEPQRKRQLIAQGIAGRPNTFLTLTVRPRPNESPTTRAQKLVRAWRIIRKRAKRLYGYKALPFLAVFEKTKRGEPHLHILLRCKWLAQDKLSDWMRELMDSPIVHIERISDKGKAAYYVSKYCGKAGEKFVHSKRYWRSPDYDAEKALYHEVKDQRPGIFEIFKQPADAWIAEARALGHHTRQNGRWTIIEYAAFEGSG